VKQTFAQASRLVEYAVASVPSADVETADRYLVKPTHRGVLAAVVEGSGHSAEAAKAALLVTTALEAHLDEGVIPLIRRCHEELQGTRGAAMSLVSVDGFENTVTWIGVGNIEGVLLQDHGRGNTPMIPLLPGVVGFRLPALQASVTPIVPGNLLILTTDGIRSDYAKAFSADDPPGKIAGYISSNFQKGHADGMVLTVRYLGWNR
jgi:hypothetical protein